MVDAKSLKPLPYYKWFWQDFRANRKVQRMNYVERGLYRELLDECWAEGGIPDDLSVMADICGCPDAVMADAWQVLSKCFVLVEGRWQNEKLESMRTDIDRNRVKKQAAGRNGGIAKSLIQKQSVASASKCQTSASVCHIEEKSREEKSNPPNPPDGGKVSHGKKRKPDLTLTDWLTALGDKPAIPEDDPILIETDSLNIPREYMALAFRVFKRDWASKKQKDWPKTFRNAIRKNWLKLWFFDATGTCKLTTAGEYSMRTLG